MYAGGLPVKNLDKRKRDLEEFQAAHDCMIGVEIGAIPYFVGVWETVAALGWTHVSLSKLFFSNFDEHFVRDIPFARHAMAIDEYRRDFVRVPWGGSGTVSDGDIEGVTRFRQVWFAGNHSDVGGSYPENESRLSDVALKWMVDFITKEIPDVAARIAINDNVLHLRPSYDGMMHDELMVGHGPEHNIHFWPACACGLLGEAIERILNEPLIKPDSPEGKRIVNSRWVQIEAQFWKAGPMRARLIGLIRQLKGRNDPTHGSSRLQGLASVIDRDVRLSDNEIASLPQNERRALRDAILNISLRLLRLLNPTELYVDVHKHESLKELLAIRLPEYTESAINAIDQTDRRLTERLITDDDVVTALCLSALACDQVERDIRDIPYVRTFSDRVAVFIDEYQDFTEQQVFLMGFRAKRKYRQITVAGDTSQRLHAGGIDRIGNAFPFVTDPVRQINLDINFRQSKPLAQLSNCFRMFTDPKTQRPKEPCNAPLHMFAETKEIADFLASKISALPGAASVVVIAPTPEMVRQWFDLMAPTLESAFRSPIVSDRARLTERLKTHFTTPLAAKGLEFDVAVLPDISQFNEADPIALNGLYVAASRPRHAILLGCNILQATHKVVQRLCDRGDLFPASIPVPE